MSKRTVGSFMLGIGAMVLLAGWFFRPDLYFARGEPHPAIEVQREFELGKHEAQSIVDVPIRVRNRGRQPLILDEFELRCGCLAVFVQTKSGEREMAQRVEIPPREEVTLISQVTVIGYPGVPENRRFVFRTNDPRNPIVEIALRVTSFARYFSTPVELALGTVLVGERVERDIEIKASDRSLPAIDRVNSSNDHIHVAYHAVEAPSDAEPRAEFSALIGRLKVHFDAPTIPGEVAGLISLFCPGQDQPVLKIPVTGHVANPVELSPQEVILPRISNSGAVYTAYSVCRSARVTSLRLTLQESPDDIAIQLQDVPGNPSLKLIQVEAAGLRGKVSAQGLERRISLTADVGGKKIPLTLKLLIRPQDRP